MLVTGDVKFGGVPPTWLVKLDTLINDTEIELGK